VKKTFRIVFMGTPQFSVPALTALHENDYDVAMVVTAQDRPKGRGRKMAPSAVKQKALDLGYPVSQPASIKTAALLHKPERAEVEVPIDYIGFGIGDEWVVGYGLDYAEHERTLPYIGIIEPTD